MNEPQRTTEFTADSEPRPLAATERPSADPAVPQAFGRYEVRRALGAGSFGDVYLGHDSQLDRLVAIKLLRGRSDQAPGESERFLLEARKLAQLRHPGIVTVHDIGVHEGQVYIVSDYLDGPDLGRWLQEHRPSWSEAARITAAVAEALGHAHARLIVHRDVKPANIILTAERMPVLVDFGLALGEDRAGGREKGLVSGTPWYMSPEQAEGSAHRIDGRTDIYSLGVVLYEMLTGRVPFRAPDIPELLRQVCDDEPQPPRQLVQDIPPDVERACLKALSKRQQDRYTTANDFADDLRRLLLQTTEGSIYRELSASTIFGQGTLPATPAATLTGSATPSSSFRRLAREAERRQVTVLVCGCDLFESEAYLELDTEVQAQAMKAFQETCEQTIQSFDGTVVLCNEQGLLACFGFPVAHEDAACRAGEAGLRLLDAMNALSARFRSDFGLALSPWVAIHTGTAVAEVKDDVVSLVGEARNVAVRMGSAANAGQVICTEASHRMFQGRIQCASLGQQKIKGVANPVELYRVESTVSVGSQIESMAPAELSPLTGRDTEISLLKDRWEQAQEGMGQIVLLVGEPGLGKSRLIHTLKEHVLGQQAEGEVDAPVVEWRCSPHYQNTGLRPAIDFYERALGFRPEERVEDRFERMLQRVAEYDLARPEIVPLWASLLSLPTPDRFPPLTFSPVRQKEETLRLMLEWLHVRAARGPLLFVVEDLHWVDASTLEFLCQFTAEFSNDRILTLLTFRPEFKPPWTPVDHQTRLALTRLTRRQVSDLIRKKGGDSLPEAVIVQIYDRAGGVPLFVEEFSKMAQETAEAGQKENGGGASRIGNEIPSTLQDLVMARLERMEGGREVAQLAAVLGREFSHELLSAVAALDEPALLAELAKLAQAEILYSKGRPPRCTYIFKHALLEDALYNALVKAKRQQLHRRVGEVLEAQFPQTAETQPELLAHHFTEAGETEKAIGYWLKAGQRSKDRSADREAIGHLTKGLTILESLGMSRERDERELQILTTLAPAYIAASGYAAPEAGPILLRARELCERIGNPQQLFGIMLGMWEWRLVRGDVRLCVDLAADGMELAERESDPGMMMEALFMPGATQFYRGQFADSRSCCEKAVAEYDDRERTKFWSAYAGHNAGVTHRCYLALALWHLGHSDQAFKVDREMRELARAIGHPFSLGHAADFTAFLYQYCRLGTEVCAAAEEETTIATDQGFQLWHALGALHKGAGILLQGRPEESLPILRKGFIAFRATGAEVRIPTYHAILADAYTRCALFNDARKELDEGLAFAEKNDDRCHEAELHRLKGELLLAESPDQVASAEQSFQRAIETAQRQQSRAWELRATTSLARLWQRQGRRDEARAALAAVYGAFNEGFHTPDLVEADALLKELG